MIPEAPSQYLFHKEKGIRPILYDVVAQKHAELVATYKKMPGPMYQFYRLLRYLDTDTPYISHKAVLPMTKENTDALTSMISARVDSKVVARMSKKKHLGVYLARGLDDPLPPMYINMDLLQYNEKLPNGHRYYARLGIEVVFPSQNNWIYQGYENTTRRLPFTNNESERLRELLDHIKVPQLKTTLK